MKIRDFFVKFFKKAWSSESKFWESKHYRVGNDIYIINNIILYYYIYSYIYIILHIHIYNIYVYYSS